MSPRPAARRLAAVQLLAAVVDGLALSSVVVHASVHLGLAPGAIGFALAAAATTALLLAVPLGALADRVGLRTAAALGGVLTTAALVGYALAGSLPAFAAAAALFMTAQAAAGSARQGLAAAGVPAEERLRVRATMHTLLNAGLGAGTVLGALVVATGSDAVARTGYLGAAVVSLVTAVAVLRTPGGPCRIPVVRDAGPSAGALVALRDARFARAVVLATVVQLTMPVLSVLLPVWVVVHTAAPPWTAAAALGVNTVLVIAVQRRWAAGLVDARTTVWSALVAAAAMAVVGGLLAATTGVDAPAVAAVAVVAAVVVLTLGEVAGGAATWRVALDDVPVSAEGRYQAAFSMSSSAARVIGPLVALPLVLAAPALGWLALTAVMAAACLGVAAAASRPTETRAPAPVG